MTDKKTNAPEEKLGEEISEESRKYLEEAAEQDTKLLRENWDRMLKDLPKEDAPQDLSKDWIDLLNASLRFLMVAEANSEGFEIASGKFDMKRPSNLSTADIPTLQIPKETEYRTLIKEVLESIHKSKLTEFEIDSFKYRCYSALFSLLVARPDSNSIKPTAEKCRVMAKYLRVSYGDLLTARRLLVVLKGYDLPDLSCKKIDQKDAAKIFAYIDNCIYKAHLCIMKGIDWCETEASNPDFKPFADNLDEALGVIADADAALKCYQASLEKLED